MTQTQFKIGDKVKIRADVAGRWHGITFTVEKLLPKNVDLSSPHAPKGLRCAPHLLVAVDDPAASYTPPMLIGDPPLVVGTLVKFKDQFFVVLAHNARSGRYRIVKLGGANDHYTNVARSQMQVIDMSEITL